MMMRHRALETLIAALLLPGTMLAGTIEHPGTLDKDAECSSCHVKKITGKSVHSAMATPCTVCHVAKTQGDMTTLSLLMPKNQICYACHERPTAFRDHIPPVKGNCAECHDAHSSERQMLLREADVLPTGPKAK